MRTFGTLTGAFRRPGRAMADLGDLVAPGGGASDSDRVDVCSDEAPIECQMDPDSEPDAQCDGCDILSSNMCPISELKGNPVRVEWARLKKKAIKQQHN